MNIIYLVNVCAEDMIPIYHLKNGDKFKSGWCDRIGFTESISDYALYMEYFNNRTAEWIYKKIKFLVKKYEEVK